MYFLIFVRLYIMNIYILFSCTFCWNEFQHGTCDKIYKNDSCLIDHHFSMYWNPIVLNWDYHVIVMLKFNMLNIIDIRRSIAWKNVSYCCY